MNRSSRIGRRAAAAGRVMAWFALLGVAAGAAPPPEEIDGVARRFVDVGALPSVVVGVADAGGQRIAGYGRVGDGAAPDERTVYEIGSITKVFTGLLLAQMQLAGEVKVEDPVARYLPAGVLAEEGVTLERLSAHVSGLPRMPSPFRPADPGNPYVDYDEAALHRFLKAWKPARAPGERMEYSNLGAGLLGYALARRAGVSYEELVVGRICRPLKLESTRMTLDGAMRKRLAAGHDGEGRPAANWDFAALAGAGALRSSAADLLTFFRAEAELDDRPLREAMRLTRVARAKGEDGRGVGLGWIIDPAHRPPIYWHNGGTGGYHSYGAFSPEARVAVVVLANRASDDVDRLGEYLIRRMLGEEPVRPAPRGAAGR